MKFTVTAFLSVLTTACFAQRASIGFPPNGTSVAPGFNLTVQVVQPNSLTSFTEVAIAIGILACETTTSCIPPSEALGTVLYNGPFNPQFPTPSSPDPPHQNFTVTIPSTLAQGPAQLSLFHVLLNGASNEPFSETPPPVILNIVVSNKTYSGGIP